MTLLKIIELAKNPTKDFEVEEKVTVAEVEEFYHIIETSPKILDIFESTDNAAKFLATVVDLNLIYGKEKATELFYGAKTKALMKGVRGGYIPTQVHYTLLKLRDAYPKAPLLALSKGRKLISKICNYRYSGLTMLDLLQNVYGKSINLITEQVPYVTNYQEQGYKKFYEVYVKNSDEIALIDKEFLDTFSNQEIRDIEYTEAGLKIKNKLLRTDYRFKGILVNDYDLRLK